MNEEMKLDFEELNQVNIKIGDKCELNIHLIGDDIVVGGFGWYESYAYIEEVLPFREHQKWREFNEE
jgi:hypothetical protein